MPPLSWWTDCILLWFRTNRLRLLMSGFWSQQPEKLLTLSIWQRLFLPEHCPCRSLLRKMCSTRKPWGWHFTAGLIKGSKACRLQTLEWQWHTAPSSFLSTPKCQEVYSVTGCEPCQGISFFYSDPEQLLPALPSHLQLATTSPRSAPSHPLKECSLPPPMALPSKFLHVEVGSAARPIPRDLRISSSSVMSIMRL